MASMRVGFMACWRECQDNPQDRDNPPQDRDNLWDGFLNWIHLSGLLDPAKVCQTYDLSGTVLPHFLHRVV